MGLPQRRVHDDLEPRLVAWAAEYGGGRYEEIGWRSRNLISTLMEFGGFVPDSGGFRPIPIRSAADEIDKIVDRMLTTHYLQAQVLRFDYFHPRMEFNEKLKRLRKVGVDIQRTRYYELLAAAKAGVADALRA